VESNSGDEGPSLSVLESVRCLACGAVYAKPAGGGTVRQNPGCPECGYVGWIDVGARITEAWQPRRFAEGRRRRPGD
jgi:predicted  nucleic acid-binding Zn-ribbon protein